jgi:uncharacterized protein (TIGR02996 family)
VVVERGRVVKVLRGHKKAVYCLAFLADGRLATGGLEGEVRLWDVATGERRAAWAGAGRVEWLAASPDGAWLAWCGAGPWVAVADTRAPDLHVRLATQEGGPYPPRAEACAFAPDGLTLLSVGGGPRCWRVGDWAPVGWAEAWWGQRASTCLAFAPDSRTVATGAFIPERGGWGVCLWDARSGVSRPAFPAGHPCDGGLAFDNLAFAPDGRLLAGLCTRELRVWVAETGEVVHRSQAGGPLHGLAFSPGGRLLATGGNEGAVSLRETSTWAEVTRYDGRLGAVQDLAFRPDGRQLAACGGRGKVVVWDLPESVALASALEAWWRSVQEAPADADLRRVFADWLEENGLPALAAGQRYQAKRGKRPDEGNNFHTNFRNTGEICKDDEACRIDPALLYHMARLAKWARRSLRHARGSGLGRYESSPLCLWFNSPRAAEEVLAAALDRLREDDPATHEMVWKDAPYG